MVSGSVYWYYLPCELRRMILEVLAKDESNIFCYISVCREWRQATESAAFRQIHITPSRLPNLIKLAYSRRDFLQCINFHIKLQEYDCSQCSEEETRAWIRNDISIVETALRNLFRALSTWESSEHHLTLDIDISSPSDTEHYFKTCHFGKDTVKRKPPTDLRHGWSDGRQATLPPYQALDRVFGFVELSEGFWHRLQKVTAISHLQIRRQSNRQIEPVTLKRLLTFLPMLQTICYEPWREWTPLNQVDADESYLVLLRSLNSGRLKRLTIFEDFDDHYITIPRDDILLESLRPEPLRTAHRVVSSALVQASLGLESLSISFLVDAAHFFSVCQPRWIWNRLTSLALTSRVLAPGNGSCTKINNLLRDAARFAIKSPNLTVLSLWNYDNRDTCAFIYQICRAEQWAKIIWRATWIMALQPATIRMWEEIALKSTASKLSVIHDELDASNALQSRGHAIQHLGISNEIIHPQSLDQILEEAKYQFTRP